jgi:CRP/FNR family transcriptional regulator, cyclic AMP receptor protein
MQAVEWPLLERVPDADRRHFLSIARRRRFEKGEVVFHAGDPGDTLHLIASGRFAVRIETTFGDTALLRLLGPGDHFGILALLSDEHPERSASIVALERAETLSVHKDDLEQLRRDHPAVDDVLLRALAQLVRSLSDSLIEALYVPVEQRVLRRLLEAAELWGGPRPGAVVPLTQEDLAELAGTTRPTTNRVLRQTEERGLIKVSRGKVELVDPAQLAKKAGVR